MSFTNHSANPRTTLSRLHMLIIGQPGLFCSNRSLQLNIQANIALIGIIKGKFAGQ